MSTNSSSPEQQTAEQTVSGAARVVTVRESLVTIEIENAAVNHPDIAEAAVIGRYHPKWTERPLLIAVLQQGKSLNKEEVLEFLKDRLHKMAMPDDVVFTDELPHTATGKINKLGLRETYKDYQFPTA